MAVRFGGTPVGETGGAQREMGYIRGLTHGAIIGAVLGVLYAPESGLDMRRRVSRLLGQAEQMMAAESGATPPAPGTPRRRAVGGTESRARRP
ncbi:MAG: YtxH domain-containing protein [Chloroflexi bacterium]|nr:MAG: YtxH domain-containing protein [Chloroflexota bacterium]TME48207.1 MAG: YtxH domain-containing protein [Chloroflexota bacterium]